MNEVHPEKNAGLAHRKTKKIIVSPKFYDYSDLQSSSQKIKHDELIGFTNLVRESRDKIDLIYINPSHVDALDLDVFSGKILFNSVDADYIIVDDLTKFDQLKKNQKKNDQKYGLFKKIT